MIFFDFDIAVVQSCEDRILEDIDFTFCTLSNELRKQRIQRGRHRNEISKIRDRPRFPLITYALLVEPAFDCQLRRFE